MSAKKWTPNELEIVLQHYRLSDQELTAQLPGRTAGAIAATRDAVHVYHTGGHPTFHLSQSLHEWLATRTGTFRCQRCGNPV